MKRLLVVLLIVALLTAGIITIVSADRPSEGNFVFLPIVMGPSCNISGPVCFPGCFDCVCQ